MATVRLFNWQTNKTEDVPEELAAEAIRNRTHSTLEGQSLNFVDDSGVVKSATGNDLIALLERGFQLESSEDARYRKEAEEFGEGAAVLKATGYGFARGLTFGLSDQAITALELESPETLRKLREYNPTASMVGEVGSVVGSMFIPGGQGKALVQAGGLLSKAGRLGLAMTGGPRLAAAAARKAAGIVGERAIARAALEGAVEGALFATGQVISEDALGETELVSQKALVEIGIGTLLGAGAGAVVPVMGAGVRSAVRGSGKLLQKTSTISKKMDDFVDGHYITSTVGPGANMNQVVNQVNKHTKATDKEIVSVWKEHIPIEYWHTQAARKDLLESKIDELGKKLGEHIDSMDRYRSEALEALTDPSMAGAVDIDMPGVDVNKIISMPERLLKEMDAHDAIGKMEEYWKSKVDNVFTNLELKKLDEVNGKLSFSQFKNFMRSVDSDVEGAGVQWKKDAARMVKGEYLGIVDEALKPLFDKGYMPDGISLSDYNKLKRDYAILKNTLVVAAKKTSQQTSQGKLRGGIFGAAITGAEMLGGGGIIGSTILGGAAGRAAEEMLKRSPSAQAHLFESALRLGSIEALVQRATSRMSGAVEGIFVKTGASRAKNIRPSTLTKKEIEHLTAYVGGLEAGSQIESEHLSKKIEEQLGGNFANAPKVGAALTAGAVRGLVYLAKNAPKDDSPYRLYQDEWEPSAMEMDRFQRIYDAVMDPINVIERIRDMGVTKEEIDAIKNVYPQMYEEMVFEVMNRVQDKVNKKERLGWHLEVNLSTLLGAAVSPTTSSSVGLVMQSQEDFKLESEGKLPRNNSAKSSVSGQYQTRSEEIHSTEVGAKR